MAESFVVYVDESGDEGFQFKANNAGSSTWFVLSAVVVRQKNDHLIRDALAQARSILGRAVNQSLHFRNLRHEKRLPYVELLSRLPIRIVTVLVHKPSLHDPESFQHFRLYHYAVRHLLERVSWLGRDEHQKSHGDGSARIVFSNRSAMSYDDLRDYVGRLLEKNDPLEVRLEEAVIKPCQIESRQHSQYAGLQAADAVASSFGYAVNPNPYGFTEPRYVDQLSKLVYQNNRVALGYGVKPWPKEAAAVISADPRLEWIDRLFGKKEKAPGSRIPPR